MQRAKFLMIAAYAAVLAGIAAGAYVLWPRERPVVVVPVPSTQTPEETMKYVASKEFEALDADEKQKYFDEVVKHFESQNIWRPPRADLTPEERERLFKNAGPLFQKVMDARIDKYFALPPEEKIAYLDNMIDRMQRMREAGEERRRERREATGRTTTDPAVATTTETRRPPRPDSPDAPGGTQTQERRGPGDRFNPQRIKERIEGTPPEDQAKRAEFFKAFRKRMEERGIQFAPGPGGFRGFGGLGGPPGRPPDSATPSPASPAAPTPNS